MVTKTISMPDELFMHVKETCDDNFSGRLVELAEKGREYEEANNGA